MNTVIGRMKSVFRRKTRQNHLQLTEPTSYDAPISSSTYNGDDDDDDDDDDDGGGGYGNDIHPTGGYDVARKQTLTVPQSNKFTPNGTTRSGNFHGNSTSFPSTPFSSSQQSSTGFLPATKSNSNTTGNMKPPLSNTSNITPIPAESSQTNLHHSASVFSPTSQPLMNSTLPQAGTNPSTNPGNSAPDSTLNKTTTSPPINANPSTMPNSLVLSSNWNQLKSSSATSQPSVSGFPPTTNPNAVSAPSSANNSSSQPTISPGSNGPTVDDPDNTPYNQSSISNIDDSVSRVELDYPIESILVDADIRSAVAIKINDAVERDRFGNKFHVHRYTYEPTTQQISLGNDRQLIRRLNDESHPVGTRHIREISVDNQRVPTNYGNQNRTRHHHHHHRTPSNYNEHIDKLLQTPNKIVIPADNLNNLQQILDQYLSTSHILPSSTSPYSVHTKEISISEPVFYYTARALPNDPMHII